MSIHTYVYKLKIYSLIYVFNMIIKYFHHLIFASLICQNFVKVQSKSLLTDFDWWVISKIHSANTLRMSTLKTYDSKKVHRNTIHEIAFLYVK